MSFLVDANVLCEATRPAAEPKVLAWLAENDHALHVSVITLGEISRGIRLMSKSRRRTQLEAWFTELETTLDGRIFPVDLPIMKTWGDLHARNQRAGRLLPSFDSLLAATALHHQLRIATRNVGDFPPDVPVVNPWE